MEFNATEPILSNDEVQRVIDERLEAILEQEANTSMREESSFSSGRRSSLKCNLKEFWKRLLNTGK